jgi:multidrug efflux pump subunit AcrB
VLSALSGSQQVAPNFWVDPRNRVSYQINAQAPQYDLHSLDDLRNLPILGSTSGQAQIVANVASISRTTTSAVEDHYNIRPVINIYGGADGKDLGYVSDQIQKLVDAAKKDLPRILERQKMLQTGQVLFRRLSVDFALVLPFNDSSEAAEPRCSTPSAIKLPDTPRV